MWHIAESRVSVVRSSSTPSLKKVYRTPTRARCHDQELDHGRQGTLVLGHGYCTTDISWSFCSFFEWLLKTLGKESITGVQVPM